MLLSMLAFILSMFLSPVHPAVASDDWTLIKDQNDIKVYTQKTSKGYDKVKAEFTIKAEINEFAAFLKDVKNFTNWIYHCKSATIVAEEEDAMTYEIISHVPFPFSDRYVSIQSTREFFEDSIVIQSVSAGLKPKSKDLVVINDYNVKWKANKLDNGQLNVVYEMNSNPGGNVPGWLYNLTVEQAPYQTMLNLKTHLESM